MRKLFVAVVGLTCLLALIGSAVAAPRISVAEDPAGDAILDASGYMDIVEASVEKKGNAFEFRTTLAEPIPANPQLPPTCQQILWSMGIDTDLTTNPIGYPAAPGLALQAEFVVSVVWDGIAFHGILVDRRPLLNGKEAVITPRPFTFTSIGVQMVVGAGELANPTSFVWDPTVLCWSAPPGSFGVHFIDFTDPFWNPSP